MTSGLLKQRVASTEVVTIRTLICIHRKKLAVLKRCLEIYDLKGGIVRNDDSIDELCICIAHYSDDIQSNDLGVISNILYRQIKENAVLCGFIHYLRVII